MNPPTSFLNSLLMLSASELMCNISGQ
jgi:hypothetical protein